MTAERLFFDGFELRPDSGELSRNGSPVKLQPQPLKILSILASRPGEVIERDEIRRLVWGDSHLDVDASLNFCIKQIRQALGDSATSPRYVETLPRRGYRFLPPVSPSDPTPAPPQKARSNQWAAILTVALLSVVLFVLVGSRRAGLVKPRLVVLPFECRSAPELCGGVTQILTLELVRRFPSDVEVIAPASARAFTGKSPEEVARGLKATHLLTGTVTVSGRELRLAARLVSAEGGQELWRDEAATSLGDAPLLYAQLVRGIARGLRLPPPPTRSRPTVPPPPAAYEAYLEGRYLLGQNPVAAASRLGDAVLLAPRFAEAYAALAAALDGVEKPLCPDRDRIDAAARRALILDPNLAEAHFVLAHSLFHCHFEWEEAGREYQRALALDPGNAEIYHQYALFLTALGRHEEAITTVQKAIALDPAGMAVSSDLAYMLYVSRRYDESIRQARRTLSLVDQSPEPPPIVRFYRFWTLWSLLHSALQTGDDATAVAAGRGLMETQGEQARSLQIRSVKDFLGWQKTWLQRPGRRKPGNFYFDATAAAEAGDLEQAQALLEEDCRTRKSYMLLFAGVEPGLDALHGDPRFSRVLDCIRLPADAPARQRINRRRVAGPTTTPGPGSAASASGGTSGPAPPYPPG